MIGFAIVGTGAIARVHAQAMAALEKARLVGVFDTSRERCAAFAQQHGCKAYDSMESLLSDGEVAVVSICTPSGLHGPYGVMAANAKKHFITEKPMAITRQQLDEMIAAAEENGVKAAVIVQKRFADCVVKLKRAIEEGRLGQIYSADCFMRYYRTEDYYSQNGGWRGTWALDGGGALMNQGIHGVDLVQYLMGGARSVVAHCRTMARPIETEDHAYLLVEYENGAVGTIHSSTVCSPGLPCTVTICGEKGTVVLQEDAIVKWEVEGETWEPEKRTGVSAHRDPMAFPIEHHISQFADLIEAIEQDRQPVVDLYKGRRAVDIILAAYESSRQGGCKVQLKK